MSYGEKITAQRPSIWMPSSCGSTWRMRAATGWLSPRLAGRGAKRWRMSKPPYALVNSGSSGGMRSSGLPGSAAAISRRNAAANGLLAQIAVGQQRAAALEIFAQLFALGRREAEVVPAVHEHHVVAEQVFVGDVDQLRRSADAELQLRLATPCGAGSPVRRGVVAAAAVAELGDLDDAAARLRVDVILAPAA